MKNYPLNSSKRKSIIERKLSEYSIEAREKLERIEQETTFVLQEIDRNISKANSILNDRVIPIIKDYSLECKNVWSNSGFWKYFFEQAGNVKLCSYEDSLEESQELGYEEKKKEKNINLNENNIEILDLGSEQENFGDSEKNDKKVSTNDLTLTKKNQKVSMSEKKEVQGYSDYKNERGNEIDLSFLSVNQKNSNHFNVGIDENTDRNKNNETTRLQRNELFNTLPIMTDFSSNKSPIKKIQTIRKSLDTFHKIIISPQKKLEKDDIFEKNRRRSSLIQDLNISSPTLPDPPILRSDLCNIKDSSSFSYDDMEKNIDFEKFRSKKLKKKQQSKKVDNDSSSELSIIESPKLSEMDKNKFSCDLTGSNLDKSFKISNDKSFSYENLLKNEKNISRIFDSVNDEKSSKSQKNKELNLLRNKLPNLVFDDQNLSQKKLDSESTSVSYNPPVLKSKKFNYESVESTTSDIGSVLQERLKFLINNLTDH